MTNNEQPHIESVSPEKDLSFADIALISGIRGSLGLTREDYTTVINFLNNLNK